MIDHQHWRWILCHKIQLVTGIMKALPFSAVLLLQLLFFSWGPRSLNWFVICHHREITAIQVDVKFLHSKQPMLLFNNACL